MRFTTIDNNNNFKKFNQKETILVDKCTAQEFIDFVKGKVEKEYMELNFLADEEHIYAYYTKEHKLYVFEDKSTDTAPNTEVKHDNNKLGNSRLFAKALIVFMLIFSNMLSSTSYAIGYFDGELNEDSVNYTGLSNTRFTTPTGTITVPVFISMAVNQDYKQRAFTLTNPNRIQNQPSVDTVVLPDGANKNLLTAIIAYRNKFSLSQIAKSTGINATDKQVIEATQLAIWLHTSSFQVDYQIDATSITDSSVRSLATAITTWATQQLSSLPSGVSMTEHLFQKYDTSLDSSKATMNTNDNYIDFGPYTVSGQVGSKFYPTVSGGIILNDSKVQISELTAGQVFHIRFPKTYTGDKSVYIKGNQFNYELNYASDRLWLHYEKEETSLQFSVGRNTGVNGSIQIIATDVNTGDPLPGMEININTNVPVHSMVTNDYGRAEFLAPVGTYTVSFKSPEGYISPETQTIEIRHVGDIQSINLKVKWSKSLVNFFAVDSNTMKPAGNSEAFIYDSEGNAVKRIAIKNGRVSGITLPEGEYKLIQYKADGGYSINIGTSFTTLAGGKSDITILQDSNTPTTTLKVDTAKVGDSWIITLSNSGKIMFKMNTNGTLSMPLPSGNYTVMAQKSDGSASTTPINFSTALGSDKEITLSTISGEEEVLFNVVDTLKKEPIPYVVLGLFDEKRNLITYKRADANGKVIFDNIVKNFVYFVNVLAAPKEVSGYSAVGNRFLGKTREYSLELYSINEIKEVTAKDTIYRIPNVTYTGGDYKYPN